MCACAIIGKKQDDPDSPSYVPYIFGTKPGVKEICQQRRYEAVKRRRDRRADVPTHAVMQQWYTSEPQDTITHIERMSVK